MAYRISSARSSIGITFNGAFDCAWHRIWSITSAKTAGRRGKRGRPYGGAVLWLVQSGEGAFKSKIAGVERPRSD